MEGIRARRCAVGGGLSYLAGRDELQRAQGALQVGDIVLEVSQRLQSCQYCGRTAIDSGKLALAMLVSISEGLCLEGLLGAILFRALADMSAAGDVSCRLVEGKLEVRGREMQIGD